MEHSAKSQTVIAMLNKAKEELTGTPFGDTSGFPISLFDPVINEKALIDLPAGTGQFELKIAGEFFNELPYLDQNFNPNDRTVQIINAKVSVNDKLIQQGLSEWLTSQLHYEICN